MIKPELYKRTVDILVEAYFNDTLERGDYCGCAVGNLIARTNHIKIVKDNKGISWGGKTHIAREWYSNLGDGVHHPLFDTIGYQLPEVLKIERAFERADGYSDDERMFNGLMAVIDVLDLIHENTDTETTNATKQRFICLNK